MVVRWLAPSPHNKKAGVGILPRPWPVLGPALPNPIQDVPRPWQLDRPRPLKAGIGPATWMRRSRYRKWHKVQRKDISEHLSSCDLRVGGRFILHLRTVWLCWKELFLPPWLCEVLQAPHVWGWVVRSMIAVSLARDLLSLVPLGEPRGQPQAELALLA